MKSAVGPELNGRSYLQGAGLSRGWTAPLGTAAPTSALCAFGTRPAPGFPNFLSFLRAADPFPEAVEAGGPGLKVDASAFEEPSSATKQASKSSGSTHSKAERSRPSKANESEHRSVRFDGLVAMQSFAALGETPIPLSLPKPHSQPISHEALPLSITTRPIPLTPPPLDSRSSVPIFGDFEPTEQAPPATGKIGAPKTEKRELAADGNEQMIATTARVAPATVSSTTPSRGVDASQSSMSKNVERSKADAPDVNQLTAPAMTGATAPPVAAEAPSANLQTAAPHSLLGVSIQASSETKIVQPDERKPLSLQANQTAITSVKGSKISRESLSDRPGPQIQHATSSHDASTQPASTAHATAAGAGAASHPASSDGFVTRDAPSSPVAAQSISILGAKPEEAIAPSQSSVSKSTGGEPLSVLENVSPSPTWTHAGANKVEAGFQDPSLGWVSVRATADASGVHAAVLPSSSEASRMLNSSMSDLGAYLTEQHHSVQSLTLTSPQSATADPYGGRAMEQGHAQDRGYREQAEAWTMTTDREPARSGAGSGSGEQLDAVALSMPYSSPGGALISLFA